jgi:two-component system, NtrC family, nitrogen regulation sensor histidine kinase NtrY
LLFRYNPGPNVYCQSIVILFFKKYFFLVSAALALATGLYFAVGQANNETYLSLVHKGLQSEVQKIRQSMDEVLGAVTPDVDMPFASLPEDATYPYFLYKGSTLLAWSDYRYALDFEKPRTFLADEEVVGIPQGKFLLLVKKKEVDGYQYTLVSLVSLYSMVKTGDRMLDSRYNLHIFPATPEGLHLTATHGAEAIRDSEGKELFYVKPPDKSLYSSRSIPLLAQYCISLALLLLGIQLILFVRWPHIRRRYGLVLLCLYAYFFVSRGLMLWFSIPYVFGKSKVFNSQQYALSWISPSLGDLLLNCLCFVIVLLYISRTYHHTNTYRQLIRSERVFQTLVSCLMLMISYVAFYTCYYEFSHIYEKSYFTLDITQSISFNSLKVTALLIFISLSCGYFLVTHLIISIYLRLNRDHVVGLGLLAVSAVLIGLAGWLVRIPFEWVFLVHLAYLLVLYLTRLPRSFYSFRYSTTIYYLLGALSCALLMTYIIDTQERSRDVLTKKKFARQLISNSDLFAEFLLKESSGLIAQDTLIQRLFEGGTPLAREIIQQRIRTYYLDHYLDQYETEILSFDRNGTSLNKGTAIQTYDSLQALYSHPEYATAHPVLFLVSGPEDITKQYVSFIPIVNAADTVGFVALDLRMSGQAPSLHSSEFVLDEKLSFTPGHVDFSYAIFKDGKQESSYGAYNYEQKLSPQVLLDSSLYTKGTILHGFRHVGLRASGNRQVVVSSPSWGWKGTLANFSFVYLMLVIVVSLTIVGHALHYRLASFRLTYSTRIQFMLNAAFILPLLIVLFFILKIIENHYRQNQRDSQLENSRNISLNLIGSMSDFQQGKMSLAYLEKQVQQTAHDADLDLSLYDSTGRLLISSKPLLYESGLISTLINPLAQKQIVEQREHQILLEETLGSKTYNTTYVGLKSYDQKPMGVLSIPFFDARPNLDRQIIDIVASVLIVFTSMLLVFLLVSYLAANLLIDPLRVLTRKIGTTTLDQPNEPLPWQSNDEIGMLIRKYNQMLVNLESKKQVISNNEKQSAWREMARQVAHEIKNPLTPMKLTLQQLQRTIRRDDPQALEKVGRAMESIIEQIDNIGYIAQSFSDIARMPPPKIELFEITALANATFDSYKSAQTEDEKSIYHREIQEGPLYVNGDRQQFATSITSLIQNARQSIPEGRPGKITLKLYAHNENVLIEIQDNGSGIPQNIRSRVFLPNFSTREGGTGLNLAMAKRIIEYAGGSIWFETEEGKGTTFYFSVPLVKA